MLISQVTLQGFKSYTNEQTIVFQPGANAIVGANGSGKSSILEAIGFCLFDYRPSGFKLASLLSEGKNSGKVCIRFISALDERPYEVERHFSKTTTTRYRLLDVELNQALAENADEVRALLEQHLCLEPGAHLDDLFSNTIGVPQGTFTAPFLLTPAQRKGVFDPILRVDEYRTASDALRPVGTQLNQEAAALRTRISRLEGELERLPRLQDLVTVLDTRLADGRAALDQAQARLAGLTGELATLDDREREATRAREALAAATAEATRRRDALSVAQRALEEAVAAQARVHENEPAYRAYQAAEQALADLERQRSERDGLARQRQNLAREQAGLAERLSSLARALKEIAAAEAEAAALAPQAQRQGELEAALQEAQARSARLGEVQRQRARLDKERARAESEVLKIQAEMAESAALDAQRAEAREAEAAAQARQSELTEARAARLAERQRLIEQSAALENVETARCPVCEAELTSEHRAEMLARNRRAEAQLARVLERLSAELAEQGQTIVQARTLGEQIAARQRRLRDERALAAAVAQQTALSEEMAQVEASVVALQGAVTQVNALRAELAMLGDPRSALAAQRSLANQRPAREREQSEATERSAAMARSAEEVDAALAAYADLEANLTSARAESARLRPAYETYVSHQRLAQQTPQRQRELEAAQTTLHDASERQATAEEAQHAAMAAYDGARHRALRLDVAQAGQEAARLESAIERDAAQRDATADEIVALVEQQAVRERLAAELAETEDLARLLDQVRQLLREAGPHVTRQKVAEISRQASSLYADIMEDQRGRLNWTEDYELTLEQRSHTRSFAQLSGGEQMSAALALRLALLRATSNLDIAFFDEPTAHLDAERREGLAEKMMQVTGFSQMVVISHDDTFERAAQSCIRIVKDEQGSRVEEG
jgi:exonuclease SbcC